MRQPTDVQTVWEVRYARVLRSQARVNVTGMTRPVRDPNERAFLARTGQLGPFLELTSGYSSSSSRSSVSVTQSSDTA